MTTRNWNEPDIYNFATLAEQLNGGNTLDELDHAYMQVIDALARHGGKGQIQLTVNFKAVRSSGKLANVVVTDALKVTLPQAERRDLWAYADENADLFSTDPSLRQEAMVAEEKFVQPITETEAREVPVEVVAR